MSVRLTRIETLTTAWNSDEHVLRRWGNDGQANVVAVCQGLLAEELGKEGAPRLGMLLRIWKDDAAALETFGHGDEAETLRRCIEELRRAAGAGEGTGENGSAEPVSASRPGRQRLAEGGPSEDGAPAPDGQPDEKESSGRSAAWSK